MASRAQFVIDVHSLASLKKSRQQFAQIKTYYASQDAMLQSVSKKMETDYIEPMMRELRKKPRKRSYPSAYPIQFTSVKQRIYVMSHLQGKPYRRTNTLIGGYGYTLKIQSGTINFKLDNSDPKHRFVVGTWGMGRSSSSIRRYTKDIQRFHTITGWPPAYTTVQKYMIPAKEEAIATIREWFAKGFTTKQ